ncbi:MAG: ribosome silencing factor [Prevotellaceae bacterium]|jgi:ribosome-associated protein|nr:ribosome silencing factor [Prevotellaceae bacterium]
MDKRIEKEIEQYGAGEMKLIDTIVFAMQSKKAENIVHLNLDKLSKSVCSSFIVTSADSTVQVRAIADNVEEEVLKKLDEKVWRRQGDENALWIILDYGSVVVHVFQTQCRKYYALEDLWADAETVKISEDKIA